MFCCSGKISTEGRRILDKSDRCLFLRLPLLLPLLVVFHSPILHFISAKKSFTDHTAADDAKIIMVIGNNRVISYSKYILSKLNSSVIISNAMRLSLCRAGIDFNYPYSKKASITLIQYSASLCAYFPRFSES